MEETKVTNQAEGTEKETMAKETEGVNIKNILENEEFKQFMESYADKRVTEAVKTTKNKLQKQHDEEMKKTEMTQEELLQQKENELYERELKLEKIQYFKEKNYDLDLLDFVMGSDIEEASEKADLLIATINKVVEKQVAERLKGGYIPPKDVSGNKTVDSIGLKLANQVKENNKSMIEQQQKYFN